MALCTKYKSWKSHYKFVKLQFILISDQGPLQQYRLLNTTASFKYQWNKIRRSDINRFFFSLLGQNLKAVSRCFELFHGQSLSATSILLKWFCGNIRKCCYATSFAVLLNDPPPPHHPLLVLCFLIHQSFRSSVKVAGCRLKDCMKLVKGVDVCVCAISFVMCCGKWIKWISCNKLFSVNPGHENWQSAFVWLNYTTAIKFLEGAVLSSCLYPDAA